jgi:phosphoribosylformylglycinamidine synthase subunit PurS
MTLYQVAVHVTPRRGLLDPQGKAVTDALRTLGFPGVRDVHVGRRVVIETEAADEKAAEKIARDMCTRLLANPVMEDFAVEGVVRA